MKQEKGELPAKPALVLTESKAKTDEEQESEKAQEFINKVMDSLTSMLPVTSRRHISELKFKNSSAAKVRPEAKDGKSSRHIPELKSKNSLTASMGPETTDGKSTAIFAGRPGLNVECEHSVDRKCIEQKVKDQNNLPHMLSLLQHNQKDLGEELEWIKVELKKQDKTNKKQATVLRRDQKIFCFSVRVITLRSISARKNRDS